MAVTVVGGGGGRRWPVAGGGGRWLWWLVRNEGRGILGIKDLFHLVPPILMEQVCSTPVPLCSVLFHF